MPIRNCVSCGRPMNADTPRCPWCGTTGAPAPSGDSMPCPFCQEAIRRDAVKCRWCGEMIGKPPAPVVTGSPSPSAYSPPPPPPVPQAPPSTTPLVLGILGIVCCGFLAPIAWVMGNNYEAQCRAMGVEPDGNGKAGKILGMIGTALLVIGVMCFGLQFVVAAAA